MVSLTIETEWKENVVALLSESSSNRVPSVVCLRVHCLTDRGFLLRGGRGILLDFKSQMAGEFGFLRFQKLFEKVLHSSGECMLAATFQGSLFRHHGLLGRLRLGSASQGLEIAEAGLVALL